MDKLEIPSHRCHYSLDPKNHAKLLVAHVGKVAVHYEFIPLLIIDIKFRWVEVVPWGCYGDPIIMRRGLVLILIN
jgi:hypothetical protein